MVPAVMDLGKSIWQAVWYGIGSESTTVDDIAKHQKVAVVQLVTPFVFMLDMVRLKHNCVLKIRIVCPVPTYHFVCDEYII